MNFYRVLKGDFLLKPGDIILADWGAHCFLVVCGSPIEKTKYLHTESVQTIHGQKIILIPEYIRPLTLPELKKAWPHLTKRIRAVSYSTLLADHPDNMCQECLNKHSLVFIRGDRVISRVSRCHACGTHPVTVYSKFNLKPKWA